MLAIVEEEGAERASYALKLLQSEGELTIASTGKDPQTGRMVTQEYHVEGPVMIMLTTTAIDLDEELLNRCIVLTVDESREQTRAHPRVAARAADLGRLAPQAGQNGHPCRPPQRATPLAPAARHEPLRPALTFLDDRTRTRRDHEKYLTLIDTIAFLHQYQRPLKTGRRRSSSTSKSRWTTLPPPTGWPGKSWAAPWTNCRRRPGACSGSLTSWSARNANA